MSHHPSPTKQPSPVAHQTRSESLQYRTWYRSWRATALLLALAGTAAASLALWPRLDPVGEVEAIVALGGGGGERVALARRLAAARDVPLVLSAEAIAGGEALGLDCGVEIVCLEPVPVNTAGEARTTRDLAERRGWDRIAVVTSTYHVNRTRMLFTQCLGDRVDVTGARASGSIGTQAYRFVRELAAGIAGFTIRRAC